MKDGNGIALASVDGRGFFHSPLAIDTSPLNRLWGLLFSCRCGRFQKFLLFLWEEWLRTDLGEGFPVVEGRFDVLRVIPSRRIVFDL